MTREQYLYYRNSNSINPAYEYYKNNFKTGNFLNENDFYVYFKMWPGAMSAMEFVYYYYDKEFEVMKIPNKEGIYYKFL